MNTARRWRVGLATAALVVAAAGGCRQGKPPVETSTDEATVTGTVTVLGKAAKQGRVIFDPANHLRKDVMQREAAIQPDGTYTITTLIGQNTVVVRTPVTAGDRVLDDLALYFEVAPGENRYDIIFPPPE